MNADAIVNRGEIANRICAAAQMLSEMANLNGMVLTIETTPKQPLSMGNYTIVVGLRPSHEAYRSMS
jgi:hypothetical protein